MSDSVRPHRRQPTRLPHLWDSPGKNTGVGCHFLLQCIKVKSESEVVQSCPTLSDPMDCSLPGSSIHGIFQARVLEWGAIAFSLTLRGGLISTWAKPPSREIRYPVVFQQCLRSFRQKLDTINLLYQKEPQGSVSLGSWDSQPWVER